jgi:tRNA-splicing ligase RtcB (3'-phosphate/5'-hydroxy nucleic acid ligase)
MSVFHEGPISMPRAVAPATFELARGARPFQSVPLRMLADRALLDLMLETGAIDRLLPVTTLPGIADAIVAMPGGTVAGTRVPDGVLVPQALGPDINRGVRLLASGIGLEDARSHLGALVVSMRESIAAADDRLRTALLPALEQGSRAVIDLLGLGRPEDLAYTESGGAMTMASPVRLSGAAVDGGRLGTLGRGGTVALHVVDSVLDRHLGRVFGLAEGELCVLVHTGSQELGRLVLEEAVRTMDPARCGIVVGDHTLACAPMVSPDGQAYYRAMGAAANFAWANRQVLTARIRASFARVFGSECVQIVYDAAHALAKIERHGDHALCVHRNGAARLLAPNNAELPPRYQGNGQPAFVLGAPNRVTHVLCGSDIAESALLASCPVRGNRIADAERVVSLVVEAGIARRVATLRPIATLGG